ncbi:MAG: DUF4157 domain-containing protein [Acidobacteriota bacterium]
MEVDHQPSGGIDAPTPKVSARLANIPIHPPGNDGGSPAAGESAVQRLSINAPDVSPSQALSLASSGTAGAGQPLPYLKEIQPLFAPHDLSGIQAYSGPATERAAAGMGAEAFTVGEKVGFAESTPDKATVIHETTHVLQQRAGLRPPGGLDRPGDPLERQAEGVARQAGKSLFLDGKGESSLPVVQRLRLFGVTKNIETLTSSQVRFYLGLIEGTLTWGGYKILERGRESPAEEFLRYSKDGSQFTLYWEARDLGRLRARQQQPQGRPDGDPPPASVANNSPQTLNTRTSISPQNKSTASTMGRGEIPPQQIGSQTNSGHQSQLPTTTPFSVVGNQAQQATPFPSPSLNPPPLISSTAPTSPMVAPTFGQTLQQGNQSGISSVLPGQSMTTSVPTMRTSDINTSPFSLFGPGRGPTQLSQQRGAASRVSSPPVQSTTAAASAPPEQAFEGLRLGQMPPAARLTLQVGNEQLSGIELLQLLHRVVQRRLQELNVANRPLISQGPYRIAQGQDYLLSAGRLAQAIAGSEVISYPKMLGESPQQKTDLLIGQLGTRVPGYKKGSTERVDILGSDLSYKSILRELNALTSRQGGPSEAEIARDLLLRLRTGSGDPDDARLTDPGVNRLLDGIMALFFGLEASRVNATFGTAVMILELVANGHLTFRKAFADSAELGGFFSMATLRSGSGNLVSRKSVVSEPSPRESLEEHFGGEMKVNFPDYSTGRRIDNWRTAPKAQHNAVPLKEILNIIEWLRLRRDSAGANVENEDSARRWVTTQFEDLMTTNYLASPQLPDWVGESTQRLNIPRATSSSSSHQTPQRQIPQVRGIAGNSSHQPGTLKRTATPTTNAARLEADRSPEREPPPKKKPKPNSSSPFVQSTTTSGGGSTLFQSASQPQYQSPQSQGPPGFGIQPYGGVPSGAPGGRGGAPGGRGGAPPPSFITTPQLQQNSNARGPNFNFQQNQQPGGRGRGNGGRGPFPPFPFGKKPEEKRDGQ